MRNFDNPGSLISLAHLLIHQTFIEHLLPIRFFDCALEIRSRCSLLSGRIQSSWRHRHENSMDREWNVWNIIIEIYTSQSGSIRGRLLCSLLGGFKKMINKEKTIYWQTVLYHKIHPVLAVYLIQWPQYNM